MKRNVNALDAICLLAIGFYQRQLSPRKGYRCAYARVNGGAGCSGFVRAAIEQHGLRDATPRIRARFGACKAAARALRAERDNAGESPITNVPSDEAVKRDIKRQRRRTNSGNGPDCLDLTWCFCLDMSFDCGPGDFGCIDCVPCDCSPCD